MGLEETGRAQSVNAKDPIRNVLPRGLKINNAETRIGAKGTVQSGQAQNT